MEPLKTDEYLPPEKRVKKRDLDTIMLAGCGTFLFSAIGTYFLSVWPFFIWREAERISILGLDFGLGVLPAMVFGIIACRRGLLAGGCGFVGGAMTTAVFLFLRLDQLFLAAHANQAPPPEYEEWLRTALPMGIVVLAAAVAVVALPKQELNLGADSEHSD